MQCDLLTLFVMEKIDTSYFMLTRNGIKKVTGQEHKFQVGEVIYGFLGQCFSASGNFVVSGVDEEFIMVAERGGKHRIEKLQKAFVRPVSEKFGIGYYYEDKDMPEFVSKEEVDRCVREAQEEKAKLERIVKRLQEQAEEESLKLKSQFPYLNYYPLNSFIPHKEVTKNVRLWLKHNFPGKKFSVKMDGYDSIIIDCADESVKNEVQKSVSRFKDCAYDESGDYLGYNSTVFNKCFGGTEFLFVY